MHRWVRGVCQDGQRSATSPGNRLGLCLARRETLEVYAMEDPSLSPQKGVSGSQHLAFQCH